MEDSLMAGTGWLPHVLWNSSIGFTLMVSTFAALVGGATGSLTIGFVAGYSMFAWIAIHANVTLLTDMLIVTLVLIVVGFGFKIWRTEGVEG